ncbi:hypothetical protein GCM10020254_74970 [Streptomyces goshikiensis]
MRLDGVDLCGRQSGAGEGGADDALLRGPVGGRQAVAGAVLVDGGAPYDREHRVTVALGVGEPLDEQHADTLTPAGAIGRAGERLDAAVGGEAALTAELDERTGRRHHGDTTGQRDRALAVPQGLDRPVQGDERGGAGRVDGDGRAFEPEHVRQAAGHDAGGVAGAQVALKAFRFLHEDGEVVLAVGADEHARLAAAQRLGVDPGALEGLPRGLQQEPLLRVHREASRGEMPKKSASKSAAS